MTLVPAHIPLVTLLVGVVLIVSGVRRALRTGAGTSESHSARMRYLTCVTWEAIPFCGAVALYCFYLCWGVRAGPLSTVVWNLSTTFVFGDVALGVACKRSMQAFKDSPLDPVMRWMLDDYPEDEN